MLKYMVVSRVVVFIIVFIALAGSGKGQSTFNRQGTGAEKPMGRPVVSGQFLFVNAVSRDAEDAGSSKLYRYDHQGNRRIFKTALYLWHFQATPDNGLLLMAQERRCSWVPDTLAFSLVKIDTNAVTVSSATLSTGAGAVAIRQDAGVVAFLWDQKTVVVFDKDLNQISKTTHTLGNVLAAVTRADGALTVTRTKNGKNHLSVVSNTGQLLADKEVPSAFQLLRLKGSDRLILYELLYLYEYDYQFNLIQSKKVPVVKDFYVEDDTIFAISRPSDTAQMSFTLFDSDFTRIKTFQLGNYNAVSLCDFSQRVAVLYEPSEMGTLWMGHNLSVINTSGPVSAKNNLRISSIQLDTLFYELKPDGFYEISAAYKFTVKNEAQVNVDRFAVSVELSDHPTCGTYFHNMFFDTVQLPPGGTFTGNTGIMSHVRRNRWGWTPPGKVVVLCCIVSHSPNGEFDGSPVNDTYCDYPMFDDITSVADTDAGGDLLIYPNPSGGLLSFQSHREINSVEVYALDGRLLFSARPAAGAGTLDIGHLAAGVYMARFGSTTGSVTKRLIRD